MWGAGRVVQVENVIRNAVLVPFFENSDFREAVFIERLLVLPMSIYPSFHHLCNPLYSLL